VALLSFPSTVLSLKQSTEPTQVHLRNPLGAEILENLESANPVPWLADSWRQHMYAFASLEQRISAGRIDVSEMLLGAERNWMALEDASVYMDERRNNGTWLRSWLQALAEYSAH